MVSDFDCHSNSCISNSYQTIIFRLIFAWKFPLRCATIIAIFFILSEHLPILNPEIQTFVLRFNRKDCNYLFFLLQNWSWISRMWIENVKYCPQRQRCFHICVKETYLFDGWNEFHLKHGIKIALITTDLFSLWIQWKEVNLCIQPQIKIHRNVHLGRFSDWKRQWHKQKN